MSQSDLVLVDVAIVGGGMSGAVLALSLAALKGQDGAPLQILLLEASAPELNAHPGFDARAIALSAGTCEALARHGLWPHLVPHCSPITHIHVSDRGHCGQTRLSAAEYGLPALGQVVELSAGGIGLEGLNPADLSETHGRWQLADSRMLGVDRLDLYTPA